LKDHHLGGLNQPVNRQRAGDLFRTLFSYLQGGFVSGPATADMKAFSESVFTSLSGTALAAGSYH